MPNYGCGGMFGSVMGGAKLRFAWFLRFVADHVFDPVTYILEIDIIITLQLTEMLALSSRH